MVGLLVMQLGYTAIMARLLEPRDFGLVAGGMLVLRYVTYPAQMGIATALIQRPHLDDGDLRAAYSLALLGGLAGSAVTFATAPALAALLKQPELVGVTRALGLGLLLGSFAIVPEALLRKSLDFRSIAACQVVGYFLSNLVIAVALGALGAGAASLVIAFLANNLIGAVLLTWAVGRLPRFGLERQRASRLARFGGLVSITSLLDVVAMTSDTVAVGRLGASPLGQYSRATFLVGLPVEQASSAVTRVVAPSLSKVQADEARFGRALTQALGLITVFVGIPVAVAGAAAPSIVRLILGDQWGQAARVLPVVGAAHGLSLITQVIISAADAKGEIVARFWTQLVSTMTVVGLVIFAFATGATIRRIALAWLTGETIRLVLHCGLAILRLRVDPYRLAARFGAAAVLSSAAALPGFAAVRLWGWEGLPALAVTGFGALSGIAAVWWTWPRAPFRTDLASLGLRMGPQGVPGDH